MVKKLSRQTEWEREKEKLALFLKICKKFIVEPPEILPISFGKDVVNEGDFGQLVCTVIRGDEPFSFTWSLQGAVVSSEPGLITSQLGSRTSILMINSVGHRHSGMYTCNVSNLAGTLSSTAELKVNG
jgi:hypothetical protein